MRSRSDRRLEGGSVGSSLRSQPVRSVLARLHSEGRCADEYAKRQVAMCEAAAGCRGLSGVGRAELCREAPLAITEEAGELLYMFARACGAPRIVEFGSSLGVSTIYLAAAIRDGDGGLLIATEIDPPKAKTLAANVAEAGLGDLVEVRVGDALQTLGHLAAPADLLVLDGWNELYLPVLQLVAPSLSPDALVIADLSADDPNLDPYLEHVRDPQGDWTSITVPIDAGVEISARAKVPR